MPKSLNVNPAEVRKVGTITVPPIPVNAYTLDFAKAKKRYGADGLIAQLSLPDDEARAKVATLAQAPAGSDKSTLGIILVLLGLWVALGLFGSVTGRPGHRMDLWLLPLLLLMSAGGHGGRGRRGGGGFRGGGGSFGGGGASGGW